jgi:hypothetical protein
MRKTVKSSTLSLLVVTSVFCLVSCGGSSGSGTKVAETVKASAATSVTTSATTAALATTVASATNAAGAAATTVAAKPVTGSAGSGLCQYTKSLEGSGRFKSLDQAFDPTQPAVALKDIQTLIDEMGKRAPADLKPDFTNVRSGIDQIAKVYAKYDNDVAKLTEAIKADPAIAAQLTPPNAEAVEASNERINKYFTDVCGFKDS